LAAGAATSNANGQQVKAYIAFELTVEGQVISHTDFTCANDEEAKDRARKLVKESPVELWSEARLVARFRGNK
jgi:hypothetical protein